MRDQARNDRKLKELLEASSSDTRLGDHADPREHRVSRSPDEVWAFLTEQPPGRHVTIHR
jgi:hypothetical protein